MRSGIPWMKRNPPQKSSSVLYGESVAITPINKATGIVHRFNPKLNIMNVRFLSLVFGESELKNEHTAMPIIKYSIT